MEITITEALVELKLLDKKISKQLDEMKYVVVCQVNKAPSGYRSIEEFEKDANSKLQSVTDLITRRSRIKSSIIMSNSNTYVTIGNVKYTVAEAIEKKHSIQHNVNLLNKLTSDFTTASTLAHRANELAQSKLDANVSTLLGKEGKVDTNAVETFTKQFWSINESKVVGVEVVKIIEDLKNEIDAFTSEVDTKLTISNSVTKIAI